MSLLSLGSVNTLLTVASVGYYPASLVRYLAWRESTFEICHFNSHLLIVKSKVVRWYFTGSTGYILDETTAAFLRNGHESMGKIMGSGYIVTVQWQRIVLRLQRVLLMEPKRELVWVFPEPRRGCR